MEKIEFVLFLFFLNPLILGYIIGSIPFGIVLCALSGYGDIRKIGSGNIGATNVLRTGNKTLALLTLLLDSGKGAIPIIFVHFYQLQFGSHAVMLLGLGAILGHCFPIWLKFKGGKGVATALGVLLAAVPYAGLAACAAWLITAKITKISSLSALVAVAIAPIMTLMLYGTSPAAICALITLLVWIRHKDNIKRLMKGEEPKIGTKKKKEEPVESVSND